MTPTLFTYEIKIGDENVSDPIYFDPIYFELAADGFDALRDLNQDGISQSGELFTLGSLNIASINVASTDPIYRLSNVSAESGATQFDPIFAIFA